jgi:DNA (cytosine-5)-methyltransferase 1
MARWKLKVPVVDLFAGPGGLGEGFATFRGGSVFHVALSIEAEKWAHETLTLRKFLLAADGRKIRKLHSVIGEKIVNLEAVLSLDQSLAKDVVRRARRLTLGKENHESVLALFDSIKKGKSSPWVLIGGPPCQAYSIVGRSRNRGKKDYVPEKDDRHYLYLEYLRLLADREPTAFVMENVKGLLSSTVNGEQIFARIIDDLRAPRLAAYGQKGGVNYSIHCLTDYGGEFAEDDPRRYIVRSEKHGIPQARHRVILIGIQDGICRLGRIRNTPAPSVRDAISSLPKLRSALSRRSGPDDDIKWKDAIVSGVRKLQETSSGAVSEALEDHLAHLRSVSLSTTTGLKVQSSNVTIWNHASRGHIPQDLVRYFYASVVAGINGLSPKIQDFPTALRPKHANLNNVEVPIFSDRFRVQVANRPATTVTSHISRDGHYYIHYDPVQCRSLTVREAARLQTFPDDYIFCGPRTAQYVQVGNAVPPKLALQIARIIWKNL